MKPKFKSMKIGIDIRLIGRSQTGSEAYFFNLVENLSKIHDENQYFLFTDRTPEKDQILAKKIEELELGTNFRLITLPCKNRFWWNLWTLPAYLKKNPVDIYHTQYIAPFWLPPDIKLVLTIHDISFNFFPQFIKYADLFFLKTLIPRSIRRAERIITVSRNERKQIMEFYNVPAEKIDSIYNGVAFERFSRDFSDETKKAVAMKYGLPDRFLLYVGTLQPRKNIPSLIKAFSIYRKSNASAGRKLVIVGNKNAHNFDEKIDAAVHKYNLSNDVIFPGWVEDEDLPVIYKLARIFVFPSLYEGFGIPIIEAMAAGLPVVSSNKSCMPEVGNGAALFVDPTNPDVFAAQIDKAMNNEEARANLIQKGLESAKLYSWQNTSKMTLNAYKKTFERRQT